jgi:histidine triad (HIT) family protein
MRLTDPYDDANVFARILRGELPCWRVHEDEQALAILDLFPQGPGHTLVIPKFPARNILDMPGDALGPWMTSVQRVARGVRAAFDADGLTLFQFNGAAGGQSVFHLHMHVIPRMQGVPLGAHGSGKADDAILQEHAARISAAIAAA